ncbi:hypothetical protein BC829DRAFT_399266 [Chytridium lagenaria]|nr:hypothetical protein BC829DRAFT_399266 [Chytridium lagenaria]
MKELIEKASIDHIQKFCESGILEEPNEWPFCWYNLVVYAARRGDVEVYELIFGLAQKHDSYCKSLDDRYFSFLGGHVEMVRRWISKTEVGGAEMWNAYMEALALRHFEVAEMLENDGYVNKPWVFKWLGKESLAKYIGKIWGAKALGRVVVKCLR